MLIPLAWWLERRSLVMLPRGRRAAAFLVRSVVITLLVFALAGLRVDLRPDELTVIFGTGRNGKLFPGEGGGRPARMLFK